MDDLDKQIVDLDAQWWDLDAQIVKLYNKNAEDTEINALQDEKVAINRKIEGLRTELKPLVDKSVQKIDYEGLIAKVKAMSPVDEPTAKAMTAQVNFDEASLKKPRTIDGQKYRHDIAQLKKDTEEFMQIAGDKISVPPRIFNDTSRDGARAYAQSLEIHGKSTVNVGTPKRSDNKSVREVLFHELAHHIEFSRSETVNIAMDWVRSRATSSVPVWLGRGYEKWEIAYPDKFVSPYVGKEYPFKGSEVISMGVERLSTPKTARRFYNEDKDHFYLTLGLVAG
jgi:hypothetical protein